MRDMSMRVLAELEGRGEHESKVVQCEDYYVRR